MNIVFNDSMTMPNVTFCMSKMQAWSHFKLNESAPVDEWDMIVDVGYLIVTLLEIFKISDGLRTQYFWKLTKNLEKFLEEVR